VTRVENLLIIFAWFAAMEFLIWRFGRDTTDGDNWTRHSDSSF
jgi:hypothetical protein